MERQATCKSAVAEPRGVIAEILYRTLLDCWDRPTWFAVAEDVKREFYEDADRIIAALEDAGLRIEA
jgi:hypothetical protein